MAKIDFQPVDVEPNKPPESEVDFEPIVAPEIADPQGLPELSLDKQVDDMIGLATTAGISLEESERIGKSGLLKDIKGPIGFWEAAKQDWKTKIPFSPVGAVEAFNILSTASRLHRDDFDYNEYADMMATYPYSAYWKPLTAEQYEEKDIKTITNYMEKMAEREKRSYTGMGKFGAAASVVPAWMIEFAATGGLKKLGSEPAKKFLTKRLKSRLAGRLGGWVAGATVRTTLGMPHRTVESTLRRRLTQDPENWATSISLGWGEVFIEALSEEAGGAMVKGAKGAGVGLVSKLPFGKKFLGALQVSWMNKTGSTSAQFAKRIFTKGGYHGIVGEIGEERLATLLHGLVGTEDFDAGQEAGPLARIIAGFKQDWENKYIELGIFGTIGGGQLALGQVAGKKQERVVGKLTPKQLEIMDRVRGEYDTIVAEGGIGAKEKASEAVQKGVEELAALEGEEAAAEFEKEIGEAAPEILPTVPAEPIEIALTKKEILALQAMGFNATEIAKMSPDWARDVITRKSKIVPQPVPYAKPVTPVTEAEPVSQAKDVVTELTTYLQGAELELPEFEAEKSQELSRRTAIYQRFVQNRIKAGDSPSIAHAKASGALKGVLAERPRFKPPELSDDQWLAMEQDIQDNPYENYPLWQKNTLGALNLVRQGVVPARYEIAYLEQQFGVEFGRALTKLLPFDTWDTVSQLVGLPRATLSSGDISGLARQGRLLVNAYPAEGAKMAKLSVTAFMSEETAVAADKKIRQDPDFAFWKDAGLEFPGFAETTPEYEKEERFPTGGIAEKIPLVRRSERSFTVALNSLRFGVAQRLRTAWEARYEKKMTKKAAKQVSGWINAAAGRAGKTQIRALQQLSVLLNKVMFSPRFAISRITAPARLVSMNPIVRRSAWRSFAAMEGTNVMLAGLAALAGATVTLDPRDADFKKIKAGRLRLDLNAGFQQPLRFLYQMIEGKYKTEAGDIRKGGRRYMISRFARSKTAPWSGLIWDIMVGHNWVGEKIGAPPEDMAEKFARAFPFLTEEQATQLESLYEKVPAPVRGISRETYERTAYLSLQDLTDAALEEGWPTALLAISSIAGISAQTYKERATTALKKEKNRLAAERYGKRWDDIKEDEQHLLRKTNQETFEKMELDVRQERDRLAPREGYSAVEQAEVSARMTAAMSSGVQGELDKVGLDVGSVSKYLSKDGVSFYLNPKRFQYYEKLSIQNLEKELTRLFTKTAYRKKSISEKMKMINKAKSEAKDDARKLLRSEINKGNI